MVYKAIGLMSGSSLDGLDIAYVHLHETAGKWRFEIVASACYPYSPEWGEKLKNATGLCALDYQLLHTSYGRYLGEQVNAFIAAFDLHHKVHLIASHGHTTFHLPAQKMTAQLGDGAAIAAVTGLPVVSDLRAMDIALGGQGAPIVPIGEKLLLPQYDLLLNLGGIANISVKTKDDEYLAFDICPANRVLNMLAAKAGLGYDAGGELASKGSTSPALLASLNAQEYYTRPFPKSLANTFGTEVLFPLIEKTPSVSLNDMLRTYVEHIAIQVAAAIQPAGTPRRMLVTGGGAFNTFLITTLQEVLSPFNIELVIPEKDLINYKEAVIMALIGVLRWREEYNVIGTATGAARNSIGGALWLGGEA